MVIILRGQSMYSSQRGFGSMICTCLSFLIPFYSLFPSFPLFFEIVVLLLCSIFDLLPSISLSFSFVIFLSLGLMAFHMFPFLLFPFLPFSSSFHFLQSFLLYKYSSILYYVRSYFSFSSYSSFLSISFCFTPCVFISFGLVLLVSFAFIFLPFLSLYTFPHFLS